MAANVAAVLRPIGGGRVAVESVAVQARLRGLLSETEVIQTYRNLEDENIEAVYTFPLPLEAVLLDLELMLNGQILQGRVEAKVAAEAQYEEAINEGDSALLLQSAGPGLYTINVGNLLPRETAVVRFRYAQLHRWQGNSLRLYLPTTLAPRYGDPQAAGLAPHQMPEYVLTGVHELTLSFVLEGAHATADFECPTHTVSVRTVEGGREIRLSSGATPMDRDFVLVVRGRAAAPEGLWSPDEEGALALASFNPRVPTVGHRAPRRTTLVVDCSGSMGGDSIAQARTALLEILALVEPADHFNLIAFGSTHRKLFPEAVVASADHLRAAWAFISQLDAYMGGTDIGAALDAAYQESADDVLLITDGEVWSHKDSVAAAKRSGKRVFTVGVGSAVSEAFVRELAEQTGGACELVSPREDMAERIVRHFGRMEHPPAARVAVDWPAAVQRQVPESIDAAYDGDTLHLFAWLAEPPADHATLTIALDDGRELRQQVTFASASADDQATTGALPRVAAWRRLRDLSRDDAVELALKYQLVTEHTSCVLTHHRPQDDKADKAPALRKVPQALAAGWGGMGAVTRYAAPSLRAVPDYRDEDAPAYIRSSRLDVAERIGSDENLGSHLDYLDIPAFLRRRQDDTFATRVLRRLFARTGATKKTDTPASGSSACVTGRPNCECDDAASSENQTPAITAAELEHIVALMNIRYPDHRSAVMSMSSLDDLTTLGFRADLIARLKALVNDDCPPKAVVAAVLSGLASTAAGKRLGRNARRMIRRAKRACPPSRPLLRQASACVLGASRGG